MATYSTLPDTSIGHKKPITLQQGRALRDNPIAMFEGAAGAPRLQDAALGTTTTNAGRDWVGARSALIQAGAVGSYVLAALSSGGLAFGATTPGSSLSPTTAAGGAGVTPLSGTWRCMGNVASEGTGGQRVTLFLRIS